MKLKKDLVLLSTRNVAIAAYNDNGDLISRNGLDHLLWFYYKGRMWDEKNFLWD